MESNNLDPAKSAINKLIELDRRVKSLETKPAGEIVVRESITHTNPDTGVSVIFGKLPDGTSGFNEWVNDITPPNKPSTPVLTSDVGIFTISWDGLDYMGVAQPKDYFRTAVEMSEDGLTDWTTKEYLRFKSQSHVTGEPYDVVRFFRLISYDQNNNASEPSTVVSMKNTSSFDDSEFQGKLDLIDAKATAANTAAQSAQTVASNANTAAQSAQQKALEAAGIAESKGKVLAQSSAPAAEDQNSSTLWIDTTNGANTPKTWNGSAWVARTDKSIVDAVNAAQAATTAAQNAATAAQSALEAAGQAQASANGKNNTYYMAALPIGTAFTTGDTVYIRSAVGQPITAQHQWNGSAWIPVTLNHQVISSVDLGKATVGELDGIYIKGRSISAQQLLIGSMDNLLSEPEFNGNLVSWGGVNGAFSVDPTGSRNSTTALKIVNSATEQGRYNTPAFSVEAGSVFRLTTWVKSSVAIPASGISLRFRRTLSNNTKTEVVVANSAETAANTWVKITGTYEIPAGAIFGEVGVFTSAAFSTGNVWIDNVQCVRAADGSLIVDGSIDGKTITGALFQSTSTADRGIKLNSMGFSAYDLDGNKTISIDALTGSVAMTGTLNTQTVEYVGANSEYHKTSYAKFGVFPQLTYTDFAMAPGIKFSTMYSDIGEEKKSYLTFSNGHLRLDLGDIETSQSTQFNKGSSAVDLSEGRISLSAARMGSTLNRSDQFSNSYISMDSGYNSEGGRNGALIHASAQYIVPTNTDLSAEASLYIAETNPETVNAIPGAVYLYTSKHSYDFPTPSKAYMGVSNEQFYMHTINDAGASLGSVVSDKNGFLDIYGRGRVSIGSNSGVTITSDLSVNKVKDLGAPTGLYDAANKEYVDNSLLPSAWSKAANDSGWVDYVGGGGYKSGVWARRHGGKVEIYVMVKGGALNSAIATLPAFYRPAYGAVFPIISNGAVGTAQFDQPTGKLRYLSGAAAPSYINFFISLPLT